jgi:hypothetical protein
MASINGDDDEPNLMMSCFSLVRYNNPVIIEKNEDSSKSLSQKTSKGSRNADEDETAKRPKSAADVSESTSSSSSKQQRSETEEILVATILSFFSSLTSLNQNRPKCLYRQRILKGKYYCTVDLPIDWFGISCMTTDNFCFYLQNILIQTSQTGGQWYSDTSPFSIKAQCN